MSRILGIDYGAVRTGIAVTDPLRIIAKPLTTVKTAELIAYLSSYLSNEEVGIIVVGQPFRMSGEPSEIETEILRFIEEFSNLSAGIKIVRQDERFTSGHTEPSIMKYTSSLSYTFP